EERCEAGSRECGAQDHEEVEGQRSAPGSKSRFCVHKGGCDNRPAPATRRKHAAIGSGSDEECAALVVAQEGSAKDALRDERSGVVLHGDDFAAESECQHRSGQTMSARGASDEAVRKIWKVDHRPMEEGDPRTIRLD